MNQSKSKNTTTIGDQPATKDTLGFTPYVIALAEFLTSKDTQAPLTISIEGEWGSGKSSFMKQLQKQILEKSEELEKEELKKVSSPLNKVFLWGKLKFKQKTQTIWFNAWRHDKAESLWAAFALSFLEQISKNRGFRDILPNLHGNFCLFWSRINFWDNWLEIGQKGVSFLFGVGLAVTIPYLYVTQGIGKLNNFSEHILECEENKGVCNTLLILTGLGGSLSPSLVLLGKLKDLIGNPQRDLKKYLESPNYDKQVDFIEKFHEDFSKIVTAYAGKDEKVYVFIDDIDRCQLDKSADLLQALNLMISNDPNLIFILGMDREKVAAAITFKQQNVLPYLASISAENKDTGKEDESLRKLDYGFSFLEKFVQLSFSVPKPSEKTLDIFLEKIDSRNGKKSNREESNRKESKDKELAIFPIIEKDLTSESLKDLVKMAAPFFDFNTRRLKQYINSVRLQTYIAYYSISVSYNDSKKNLITIEHLGKFIALTLKHPRLRLELEKDNNEFANLEQCARDSNQENRTTNYWIKNDPKIKELLCHKPDSEKEDYSFKNIDIKRLLVVSPPPSPIYFKLRDFLAEGKWKEADEETRKVMLEVGDRGNKDCLTIEYIENFPCEDLRIIDTLWRKYSNDKFGFSVQKEIWLKVIEELSLNKNDVIEVKITNDQLTKLNEKLGDRLKWLEDKGSGKRDWIYSNYDSKMIFDLEKACKGHLPRKPSWNYLQRTGSWIEAGESRLLIRLEKCKI